MYETYHINQRIRQRGITKRMIELTLEFGEVQADKIRLGSRRIKKILKDKKHIRQDLKKDLLKILDKGGLVVVASGSALITAYNWN
ncbi:MAG TPA: hypothetical protein ENK77_04740 [Epsilonproteobacteria bacterium]|nr:hypothetical protein [Campylobacterota bacterium]